MINSTELQQIWDFLWDVAGKLDWYIWFFILCFIILGIALIAGAAVLNAKINGLRREINIIVALDPAKKAAAAEPQKKVLKKKEEPKKEENKGLISQVVSKEEPKQEEPKKEKPKKKSFKKDEGALPLI